jgi:putative glutamine amidotransferase
MNPQPLRIGIPARIQHLLEGQEQHYHAHHFLEQSLAHWVMLHGAMLFMIPSLCEACLSTGKVLDQFNYAEALDGLILQGGPDIAPELYGEVPKRSSWAGDIEHDTHQIRLLRQFLAVRKPVLGICRGAQLINVALGGTLHQDISSLVASHETHGGEGLEQVVHEVQWSPESSLARLYPGQSSGRVMSVHHQAIKDLGEGLSVEARCATDGVIEAIRLDSVPYVVGLQWHPECHPGNRQLLDSTPILDDFLATARSARKGSP